MEDQEEQAQNPNPLTQGMGSIDMSLEEQEADPTVQITENLDVRDFLDMVDFYQTMRSTGASDLNECEKIQTFCKAYETIGKGCGCTKKNRKEVAEKAYLDVANLGDEEALALKSPLNVGSVRMFYNGGLFAEF